LIVFCGASSVGKDVVASRVRRNVHKQFGYEIEFLEKYTTRRKRSDRESADHANRIPGSLYEPSSTYEFLSPDELKNNPDCFFHYKKYDNYWYAFSSQHLQSQDRDDRNLACILGALKYIKEFRSEVEDEFNRAVFAVLLEADRYELYDRLELRHTFTPIELVSRRSEIASDLRWIESQRKESPDLRKFYDLVVENGTTSLTEVVQCITDSIGQWLRWRDWALEEILSSSDGLK
jgi:guanylate kinase